MNQTMGSPWTADRRHRESDDNYNVKGTAHGIRQTSHSRRTRHPPKQLSMSNQNFMPAKSTFDKQPTLQYAIGDR